MFIYCHSTHILAYFVIGAHSISSCCCVFFAQNKCFVNKKGLWLNNPDNKLFLNHKHISVAELLTHFEKLTLHFMVMPNPNWEENLAQEV